MKLRLQRYPYPSDPDRNWELHLQGLARNMVIARQLYPTEPDRALKLARCWRAMGRHRETEPFENTSYCRLRTLCSFCSEIRCQRLADRFVRHAKQDGRPLRIVAAAFTMPDPISEAETVKQIQLCNWAKGNLIDWVGRWNTSIMRKKISHNRKKRNLIGKVLCGIHVQPITIDRGCWRPHLHVAIALHRNRSLSLFNYLDDLIWRPATYHHLGRQGSLRIENKGVFSSVASKARKPPRICSPLQLRKLAAYVTRLAEVNHDNLDDPVERYRLLNEAAVKQQHSENRPDFAVHEAVGGDFPHQFPLDTKDRFLVLPPSGGHITEADMDAHGAMLRLDERVKERVTKPL